MNINMDDVATFQAILKRHSGVSRESLLEGIQANHRINSDHFKPFANDKELALAAVASNPRYLQHFDKSICNDKEVLMTALRKDLAAICMVHGCNHLEVAAYVLSADPKHEYLSHFSPEIQDNEQLIRSTGCNVRFASQRIRGMKDLMSERIAGNSQHYEYASEAIRLDDAIARAAIHDRPYNAQYLPATSQLQTDKAFCVSVVTAEPGTLEHFKKLNDDPEVVLAACKSARTPKVQDPNLMYMEDDEDSPLRFASPRLQKLVGGHDELKVLNALVLEKKLSRHPQREA